MIDRPRFDVDDTTTSYSPPPADRPRWVDQGWGAAPQAQPQTPQHWFDPNAYQSSTSPKRLPPTPPALAPGTTNSAPAASSPTPRATDGPMAGSRRGMAAMVVVVALLSAGLASGGTYLLLLAGGHLDRDQGSANVARATPLQPVTITEASAMTAAVDAVGPAVVTITSAGGAAGSAVDAYQLPATGTGSGILWDPHGWVLTNGHVVCGAGALTIKLADGREFSGTLYGLDSLTDLAIVKIDGHRPAVCALR